MNSITIVANGINPVKKNIYRTLKQHGKGPIVVGKLLTLQGGVNLLVLIAKPPPETLKVIITINASIHSKTDKKESLHDSDKFEEFSR